MTVYYYLGWFTESFSPRLAQALQTDITDRQTLVQISAMPTEEGFIGEAERSWLTAIDIEFRDIHTIDEYTTIEQARYLIGKASVILLTGGDTRWQWQLVERLQLREVLLQSEAVIIGASAGAINMSATWICSPTFGYDITGTTVYKGLGLSPFAMLSHFDLENRFTQVAQALTALAQQYQVYVSNKNCAIRVEKERHDYFGVIYEMTQQGLVLRNDA